MKNIETGFTDIQKVFDFIKEKKGKYLILLTDGETKYPIDVYSIKNIWINEDLTKYTKNRGKEIKRNPFY